MTQQVQLYFVHKGGNYGLGIILKQSLQTTIVSFLAIGIGATLQLLVPFIFKDERQIGALALLNSLSCIFADLNMEITATTEHYLINTLS